MYFEIPISKSKRARNGLLLISLLGFIYVISQPFSASYSACLLLLWGLICLALMHLQGLLQLPTWLSQWLSLQQQAKQLQFHQQQLRIDGQSVQLHSWQRLPSLCIITLNHSQPLKRRQLWLWQDSMPNESWRQLQHWLKFYAAR